MSRLLLRSVELGGRRTDVRVAGDRVAEIATDLEPATGEEVIDGRGGALLPGLHDHHLHLAAMAAADRSLHLSSDQGDHGDLDTSIAARHTELPTGSWLRAVGYDDGTEGDLDRWRLDALAPGRPVRVQHRSGALWVLSTAALDRLALPDDLQGIERDPHGRPTGRLFRLDHWLKEQLPTDGPLDLAAVGRRLARYGVTGVTDATPSTSVDDLILLAGAGLPLRIVAMGGPALTASTFPPGIERGPVKIVLSDDRFPDLDDVDRWVEAAHQAGRPVAIHCVTRDALALALAALPSSRTAARGDRIEHASVSPPQLTAAMAERVLTVVTQPGFIARHGDRYLATVDPDDIGSLYPVRSLLAAAIPVGGSTDAPYGPEDPWVAIRAAVERRTTGGAVLGNDERVPPGSAIDLFLGAPAAPGGPPRRVTVGATADLCLLDARLTAVLDDPGSEHVAMTILGGSITYRNTFG